MSYNSLNGYSRRITPEEEALNKIDDKIRFSQERRKQTQTKTVLKEKRDKVIRGVVAAALVIGVGGFAASNIQSFVSGKSAIVSDLSQEISNHGYRVETDSASQVYLFNNSNSADWCSAGSDKFNDIIDASVNNMGQNHDQKEIYVALYYGLGSDVASHYYDGWELGFGEQLSVCQEFANKMENSKSL